MQSGKVTPVIDRRYKLSEVPEAIRYLEQGHARGKVVITVEDNPSLVSANLAANSTNTVGSVLIASELIGMIIGVTIVPIVAALALNRRFQRRNPGKKPYRWGYYFSIMSILGGLGLGLMLEFGVSAVIICGAIYAVLAWFFAQRHYWAWIYLPVEALDGGHWQHRNGLIIPRRQERSRLSPDQDFPFFCGRGSFLDEDESIIPLWIMFAYRQLFGAVGSLRDGRRADQSHRCPPPHERQQRGRHCHLY
jgi:hypothetical protein